MNPTECALIVEPNPQVARSLEMVLSTILRVQIVSSIMGARQQAAAPEFGLIVANQRMPLLPAWELTPWLQQIDPTRVFIWITGHPQRRFFDASVRMRVVDYVDLPFGVPELCESVEQALALRRELQSGARTHRFGPYTTELLRLFGEIAETNPLRRWRRRTQTEITNAARRLGVDAERYLAWESGQIGAVDLDRIAEVIGEPDLRSLWERWIEKDCASIPSGLRPYL